jgi:hypothetical protein
MGVPIKRGRFLGADFANHAIHNTEIAVCLLDQEANFSY